MTQDLKQVEYGRGLLENGIKPESLLRKISRGAETPSDLKKANNPEDILNLGSL